MADYKPLSEMIKKVVFKFLKTNTTFKEGFLFSMHRIAFKAHLDEDECTELLESLVINKENVLRYLGRKYIPTWSKKGALFPDQKCIQKALIKDDKSVMIHIKNSEPHKIMTDTIHVLNLLREKGFEFNNEIKFVIEELKIANQDIPLYELFLQENGFRVPMHIKQHSKNVQTKFATLESVAACKKRTIKRKFLRLRVKKGELNWKQLRAIIAIEDFSKSNIKRVCDQIRSGEIS
jgi:hypothetical protein